jgi:DNA-binding NarL/FixJ family response regulator
MPGTGPPCDAAMMVRCLIVDDSPRFLAAARVLLEREGVEVVGVASTGAEALRSVAALRPDITLVDIDLGAESGFEVAFRLSRAGGPPPRVILISTYAERDYAELIEACPVLGFLSKAALSAGAIHTLLGGEGDGGGNGAAPTVSGPRGT